MHVVGLTGERLRQQLLVYITRIIVSDMITSFNVLLLVVV